MRISEFLSQLSAKGFCCFSSEQAKKALDISDIALRAALRRLKKKGTLAQPVRGFNVIVPPEYRILGCRPAEHFINELMEFIDTPYYVGLLSAAQYYGAAHHKPQQYQVVINQKRRAITCGRVKIVFVTKQSIQDVPVQRINTPQSIVTVSTPEATAMDLIIYANRCGGLDNVLAVLTDLVKKIDPHKLEKLAAETKEITWVQRLGYLLDSIKINELSDNLLNEVKQRSVHIRSLVPMQHPKKIIKFDKKIMATLDKKRKTSSISSRNKKWKLIINKKLEPEV